MNKHMYYLMPLALILFLPSFHAISAVAYGTCEQYPGNYVIGNDYTRAQCKAETLETFKISYPTAVASYETGGPTYYRYYAVNSTGGTLGQTGYFAKTGTMECPSGTVQNSAGTGCEPDPQAVCQAKAGQTVYATATRPQGSEYPSELTIDGCAAVPESGVGVCVFEDPANPETSAVSCYSEYRFTGAPGSSGAPLPDQPVTPPPDGELVPPQTTVTGTPTGPGGQIETVTGAVTVQTTEGPPSVQTVERDPTMTTNTTETTEPRPGGGSVKTTETVVTSSGGVIYTLTGGTGQSTDDKPGVEVTEQEPTSSFGTAKETTYPDGSKSGTCEGPACEAGGKEAVTSYTGGACKSVPTCTGDPIQCAQAVNAWRTQCQIQLDNERIFGTPEEDQAAREAIEAELIETPKDLEERLGVTVVDFSDYAEFAENLFPVAASCPGDQTVTVMGHAINVSYGPFCQLADVVRPIVILVAYILASIILFRAIALKH